MKKLIVLLIILFFSLPVPAKENTVNVAFAIDNNYPIFTLLAINSILLNSDASYTFFIVENNLTDKNKKKMRQYVRRKNQNIEFIHIDTKKIDDGDNLFAFSNRITPIAIARILLPDLLPDDVHRVLYLDGDILVNGDLQVLYNSDLCGRPAGMALNIATNNFYKFIDFKSKYYNSGMILMDLDKWREDDISAKMLSYLKSNKKKFIYEGVDDDSLFLYPDQDLINVILLGKITTLPQKWNNQTIDYVILDKDINGVIHYIGDVKPWDFPIEHNELISLYYDYWDKSSLKIYKYYYGLKVIKNLYLNILEKKLNRYKDLKTNIIF